MENTNNTEELSLSAYLKSNASNADDLVSKLDDKVNGKKKSWDDPRIYKYKMDKTDNCVVLLRFLPSKIKNGLPVVHRMRHVFQDPSTKRWLFETCPTTTKGSQCPICEDNGRFFKDDVEGDMGATRQRMGVKQAEDYGRARSRKKEYYSNIYIIQDSNQPENNGKVFIWQYGPEVYNKIQGALKPSEKERNVAGKKPLQVFDIMTGGNFVLNLCRVESQVNYDKCMFQSSAPFLDGDIDKIKLVWDKIYDLSEFEPSRTVKPYEELCERFLFVTGKTNTWKGKTETPTAPQQSDPVAKTLNEEVASNQQPEPQSVDVPVSTQQEQKESKVEEVKQEQETNITDFEDYFKE